MKRAIIAPAPLSATALAELKQWLGINTTREDALLTSLLSSSLDMFESYTGIRPVQALVEEIWPVHAALSNTGWQELSCRPVDAISSLEAIAASGARTFLPTDAYAIDLDADGVGRFRVTDPGDGTRVAVRFTAGLATRWDNLPDAIRQGAIRLATHHHRTRDDGAASTAPPAAVVALWHPWRRMRLA